MSRIGKAPISIPEGVTVDFKDGVYHCKRKIRRIISRDKRY